MIFRSTIPLAGEAAGYVSSPAQNPPSCGHSPGSYTAVPDYLSKEGGLGAPMGLALGPGCLVRRINQRAPSPCLHTALPLPPRSWAPPGLCRPVGRPHSPVPLLVCGPVTEGQLQSPGTVTPPLRPAGCQPVIPINVPINEALPAWQVHAQPRARPELDWKAVGTIS